MVTEGSTGYPSREERIKEILSTTQDVAKQIDEIAQVRHWFRPHKDSKQYSLIQEYIGGKTDLTETATKLFTPLDEAISANRKIDADLEDFWYSIIHSAKRIPYRNTDSHTHLVDLVKAFKEHPEPPHRNGHPIFASLDGFGIASREAYNDGPGVNAEYFEPEIQAWANVNYFYARLTSDDFCDLYLYAIWTMREALENVQKDEDQKDCIPNTALRKYDALVPAAAVWVFALGRKLYESEKDFTPKHKNQGNLARGGELWTGKPELSKERWALWKKRFEEISGMEELRKETRNVAREAFEAMEKAEQS